MDDIILAARTYEQFCKTLEILLARLKEDNIILRGSKCAIGHEESKWLGFIISRFGVKPNPEKFKSLMDTPIPQNARDVRAFLGLVNFHRMHVSNYADVARVLTVLTKKQKPGTKFEWNSEHQKAWEKIKTELAKLALLYIPDESDKLVLYTDASSTGAGSVLCAVTKNVDGKTDVKPVGFWSKAFKNAQIHWDVGSKEA